MYLLHLTSIFSITGKTSWALKCETIKKIVDIVIIVVAVSISFEALVWSQVVIAVFELVVNLWYTKKQIGLGYLEQFRSVARVFICSVLMALIVGLVASLIEIELLKLIIGVFVGVIVYAGLCLAMNVNNSRNLIKKILNR